MLCGIWMRLNFTVQLPDNKTKKMVVITKSPDEKGATKTIYLRDFMQDIFNDIQRER
jgi:hypothetical protein